MAETNVLSTSRGQTVVSECWQTKHQAAREGPVEVLGKQEPHGAASLGRQSNRLGREGGQLACVHAVSTDTRVYTDACNQAPNSLCPSHHDSFVLL